MAAFNKAFSTSHFFAGIVVVVLLLNTAGCVRDDVPADGAPSVSALTIGFGLTSGQGSRAGIRNVVGNVSLEPLFAFGRDGRPQPWLIDRWHASPDRLRWTFQLKPSVTFHDGTPLTAVLVRDAVRRLLPGSMGPAFEDVKAIEAISDLAFEIELNRPSSFVVEGLDFLITRSEALSIGTGPYEPVSEDQAGVADLRANQAYFGGRPLIDRIRIEPYASVRAAWADLLREQIDMVYEVGVDALDSLDESSEVNVFVSPRSYAYIGMLNVRRASLRDPAVRRALNAAINREALVEDVFRGHASAATGPVSPQHWAYDARFPKFDYRPQTLAEPGAFLQLTCLIADRSLERLGLTLQQQLREVGVDLKLEILGLDEWYKRALSGDFDVVLADALIGPTLLRPFQFWHSGSSNNWGHYSSNRVDQSLDLIRASVDEKAYSVAVANFQRAIVEDPPAIFLVWSQRARAVSARFEVPVEPGRDILGTLRLWRPVGNGTDGAEDLRESVH